MRACFLFIAFVFLLTSCKKTGVTEADALAEVSGEILYRTEVKAIIPVGMSTADSLLFAENYVKKWIKDNLIFDVASRNLGDDVADVNKLVDAYRKSLMRYRYQERLVSERLTANIQESDKLTFYEENQDKFKLDDAIVKGLFLKIPVEAPGLSDVKKWYRSNSVESLEKIEKYSIQNANIYEYFYDRWVNFGEVISNIPVSVSNVNVYLQANKHVEVTDSSFCYLLNIEEYIKSGSVAPYDYAESRIVEMLINQKKKDFIEDFEENLYRDAVKRGDVKIYSNN